jgi:hypothetical protein
MQCTVDEALVREAQEALGAASAQAAIEASLREAIRRRRVEEAIARLETIEIDVTEQEMRERRYAELRERGGV